MKDPNSSIDAIHALSQAIVEAKDSKEIYNLILNAVVRFLKVEKASIMAYDPQTGVLRVIAARGMDEKMIDNVIVRVGEGISGKVFASHKPVLIKELKAEEAGPGRDRYRTRSLISAPVTCFPMKVGNEPQGVINVTDKSDGSALTEEDLQLLTTLSNQAAAYIHICKLVEERGASEKLKQQLEIARQIQYRLLPADFIKIEGMEIAGRLITAEKVGGDYYDCFMTGIKRPSFVIADVAGHSIGAALTMAAFRAAVRAQKDSDYSPSMLVQRINHILYEDLFQAEQFISMVYLQYIRSRQLIQYTAAGHLPPIVWRAANKAFEEIDTGDGLLGLEPHAVFHEKQLVVSKGDVILLYTDGIIEAANKEGERFGKVRLMEVFKDSLAESSRQIVDVIVESVQAFVDPGPLRDDITAMILKVV